MNWSPLYLPLATAQTPLIRWENCETPYQRCDLTHSTISAAQELGIPLEHSWVLHCAGPGDDAPNEVPRIVEMSADAATTDPERRPAAQVFGWWGVLVSDPVAEQQIKSSESYEDFESFN